MKLTSPFKTNHLSQFELNTSVFVSVVSLGIVCFYVMARLGFDNTDQEFTRVIGINFFLIFSPLAYQILFNRKENNGIRIGSSGLITFAAVLLLIVLSFIIPFTGYWLLSILVFSGYLFFLAAVLLFFKTQKFYFSMLVLFLSGLAAIWASGRVYSSFHNPLAFENLVIGQATNDTFFHASVMQMIKTFGIPSTGLNGTPYLSYHWGSHWILARFATLMDLSAISTYHLVYPSLFLCLFIKSLANFGHDLFLLFTKNKIACLTPGITFWAGLLLLLVGFLPYSFLSNWAVWDSWVESESYAISLMYFFLLGSIVLYLHSKQEVPSTKNSLIWYLPIVFLLPWLGLIKVSLLVIGAIILFYLFIKLQLFKTGVNVVMMIMMLGLSYCVVKMTVGPYASSEENDNFYLFHFLKTFSFGNWRGLFYYMHYFFTILYVFLRARELNLTSDNLKSHFRANTTLDIEILIIISLAGLLPASLLRIDGGSAYYFTDIQSRISAAFLLSYLLKQQFYQKSFLSFTSGYALVVPAFLFIAVSNIFSQFENAINKNMSGRLKFSELYAGETRFLKTARPDILFYTSGKRSEVLPKLKELALLPAQGLKNNEAYEFVKALRQLDKLDRKEKQKMSIYIPRSNSWYWHQLHESPSITSFLIPALTGISSVGGLPEKVNDLNYGFSTYKDRLIRTDTMVNNERLIKFNYVQPGLDSICSYLKSRPFDKVLIINRSIPFDTLVCR